MVGDRTLGHRRREHRQYFPRPPVAWKTKGAGAWRTGWLNDLSASGAAMLVPMDTAPKAGQEVELCPDRQTGTLPCRVVRTEAREDDRDLVACRVISADGCPARLRPAQDPRKAHQQVPGGLAIPGARSKQSSADLAQQKSA